MDIYLKPTDAKRYVTFKSNHSKHCLKNIPFFLAHRICMITEKDSLKEIKLKEYLLLQLLIWVTPKTFLFFIRTMKNLKTLNRMRKAIKYVKFIKCTRQAPNLLGILEISSFSPSNSNSEVSITAKVLPANNTSRKVQNIFLKQLVKNTKQEYHLVVKVACNNQRRNLQWLQGRMYREIINNG